MCDEVKVLAIKIHEEGLYGVIASRETAQTLTFSLSEVKAA
jgi:hypothetical protein